MLTSRWGRLTALLLLFGLALFSWRQSPARGAEGGDKLITVRHIELVSVGTGGEAPNESSFAPIPSYDGRYVTFISYDSNWYPEENDPNFCRPSKNCQDIFVRDRVTDTTIKLSVNYEGVTGNHNSIEPGITSDGSLVVFSSYAFNLVSGDTNGSDPIFADDGIDTFLYTLSNGSLARVSLKPDGSQIMGNSAGTLSKDGRYISFVTNAGDVMPGANGESNIFVVDRYTNTYEWISRGYDGQPADGESYGMVFSADGRYLTFVSYAGNLVDVPNFNQEHNVFLYDRQTGEMTLVSRSLDGDYPNDQSGQPVISADGSRLVFKSDASDLTPGDTNGLPDVFSYDVATGEIQRISVGYDGSQPNGLSRDPSVCDDGSVMAFTSDADNIVPGDTNGEKDLFFYDFTRQLVGVIRHEDGSWGNYKGHKAVMTGDCRSVVFATDANFLPEDDNLYRDIYYAELVWPADISGSRQTAPFAALPGEVVHYSIHLVNDGSDPVVVNFASALPPRTTYVLDSATEGATYNTLLHQVIWSGSVEGWGSRTITFAAQVDEGISETLFLPLTTTIEGADETLNLVANTVINGQSLFLPVIRR